MKILEAISYGVTKQGNSQKDIGIENPKIGVAGLIHTLGKEVYLVMKR